ncbi:MAG: hypothetical protein ABI859_10155 [Pseudomonadota bacterium]
MALAGMVAAWLGADRLARIPKAQIKPVIAGLLSVVALLLVVEAFHLLDGMPPLQIEVDVHLDRATDEDWIHLGRKPEHWRESF